MLAAGSGKRMGTKVHKQYLLMGGKPVLYYSLKAFEDSDLIDEIILVTGSGEEAYCREQAHVVTAVLSCVEPPSREQLQKMETFLCGRYGAEKAEIQVCRNESLMGGFILRAGNDEYDWSIKGRLDRLKQKLTWR